MVKRNCIRVSCHPQAAPPEPVPGAPDSFPGPGRSCWALTQPRGAAIPCSLIFSPQLWFWWCSGTRQCPAQGVCCVLLWDVNIPLCRELLCHVLSVDRARIAPISELNCRDVLVLTQTPPWEHHEKWHSDLCCLLIKPNSERTDCASVPSGPPLPFVLHKKYQTIIKDLCWKTLTQNIGLSQMGFKLETEETQE